MNKEATMSFRIEPELRSGFMRAAASEHRPASQILRELMRGYVARVGAAELSRVALSAEERRLRDAAVRFAVASAGLSGFRLPPEERARLTRFGNGEMSLEDLVEGPPTTSAVKAEDESRHALEGERVRRRVVELELSPTPGRFDAAHLREVNRRIAQDSPRPTRARAFADEARGPGGVWVEEHRLEAAGEPVFAVYALPAPSLRARLDGALARVDAARLGRLGMAKFVEEIAALHGEVDYLHPFASGNGLTLRSFTRQLAGAAGYILEWERFNESPAARDALRLARDAAVNELALPHIRDEEARRKAASTRLAGRSLVELLRGVVRPV